MFLPIWLLLSSRYWRLHWMISHRHPCRSVGFHCDGPFSIHTFIKYWIQFINNQSYRVTNSYFFHLARFWSIAWIRPLIYHPYFHYDTLCILFSISVLIYVFWSLFSDLYKSLEAFLPKFSLWSFLSYISCSIMWGFSALSSLNYLNGHSWCDWLHLRLDWPLIRRCRRLKCRCSICLIVYLMKLYRAKTLCCTLNQSRSVSDFSTIV